VLGEIGNKSLLTASFATNFEKRFLNIVFVIFQIKTREIISPKYFLGFEEVLD
jgi:hypothetical protein